MNNIAKLLSNIFKAYNIQITYSTIEKVILTHPAYPSMQSISDAFDAWKIKHVVMKITIEKLQALGIPALVQMKKKDYVWVTQVTDSNVYFLTASGRKKVETRDNFEKNRTGVALAIEDISIAGEPDYQKKRLNEIKEKMFRFSLTGSCIAFFIILMFLSWHNDTALPLLLKSLLFMVNATGLSVSYILIRQEKNQANDLIRKICTFGSHVDCNQVTRSGYSKFFGLISWSEIGMAYFSAVTIWIAVAPFSTEWVLPLAWTLLIPLPFTFWSLFTQAFLIRKWCLFCSAIVFLIWVNSCLSYFYLPLTFSLPVITTAFLLLLVLVCTVAVIYTVSTRESGDKYHHQRDLAKIKYDFPTIQSQLSGTKYETNHIGFAWGNPQSSNEIALFVSIACSHCGAGVKELRRLMEIYPDFSYRLIFAVYTDDYEHKSNSIIRYFISLYKTLDTNVFFDMLDVWYTTLKKNFDALQQTFPISPDDDNSNEIASLFQFKQQAKISYTPAILINGRLLSQLYSYNDLYGIVRAINAEEV